MEQEKCSLFPCPVSIQPPAHSQETTVRSAARLLASYLVLFPLRYADLHKIKPILYGATTATLGAPVRQIGQPLAEKTIPSATAFPGLDLSVFGSVSGYPLTRR